MEDTKMKITNRMKSTIAISALLVMVMITFLPVLRVAARETGDGQAVGTMLLEQQSTKSADQKKAETIEDAFSPVADLIKKFTAPVLGIVGAVGSVYCIILGVKFAKAEEPQEREKAKSHLKNAIIGFVLIFVLLVLLWRLMDPLIKWVANYSSNTGL